MATSMTEYTTTITKAYRAMVRENYNTWPTKLCGPEPTEQAYLTAWALVAAKSSGRSNRPTEGRLAIAMILRPDGATDAEFMIASGCAQSKQNLRTELSKGHHGQGGLGLISLEVTGTRPMRVKAALTPKGQKAVDKFITAALAGEPEKAKPKKAKADGKVARVRKPKAPAAIEAPADANPPTAAVVEPAVQAEQVTG